MDDKRINFTIRILPELRTRLRFAHAQTGRTIEQLGEEALTNLCDKVLPEKGIQQGGGKEMRLMNENWADSQPYDLDELLSPPPGSIKKKWKQQKEIEKFMRRKIDAVQRNALD